MTVDEGDVILAVESSIPSSDHVQTVTCARERWGIKPELPVLNDFWTVILNNTSHDICLVQPFIDVVSLVPRGRPDRTLRAGLVQVRFVS